MKLIFLTALAGLLVACTPNVVTPTETTPTKSTTSAAQPETQSEVLTVTRHGSFDGQTLILIPGLASSADVWTDTAAAFADYDIRLVQVGGFAGAAPFMPTGSYADAIADALLAHLAAQPGRETVIIGHSMGGFVSLIKDIPDQFHINVRTTKGAGLVNFLLRRCRRHKDRATLFKMITGIGKTLCMISRRSAYKLLLGKLLVLRRTMTILQRFAEKVKGPTDFITTNRGQVFAFKINITVVFIRQKTVVL